MSRLIRMDQTRPHDARRVDARRPGGRRGRRRRRSARSWTQGSIAMVTRGPGHAEHVRELPLDEQLVIMRRPIAGG